jgi:hypothetical protein
MLGDALDILCNRLVVCITYKLEAKLKHQEVTDVAVELFFDPCRAVGTKSLFVS